MTFEWVTHQNDRYEAEITGPHDGWPFHRWYVSYSRGIWHLEISDFARTRERAEAKARRRLRKWNAELARRQTVTIKDSGRGEVP